MPVEPAILGAFIITASALVISPGPDTVLIVRYALSSGHRVGLAAVAGVQLGLLVHTALAVAGISVIIASSPVLFKGVAFVGAAYLAWLGVQGFRGGGAMALNADSARVSSAKAFRDAMLTNLLNPKVILIFLALLPNFIDTARDDISAQLMTLAVTLIIINVIWQVPIAWLAVTVRHWLGDPAISRMISRLTGGILLIFAALMVYENVR